MSGGKTWQPAANWSLTPQLGLAYDYVSQRGFSEAGGAGFGMRADALHKGVLSSIAALNSSYAWQVAEQPMQLTARLQWTHDFSARDYRLNGGFNGLAASTGYSGQWQVPRNRWAAGLAWQWQPAANWAVGADYQYDHSRDWRNHYVGMNLHYRF